MAKQANRGRGRSAGARAAVAETVEPRWMLFGGSYDTTFATTGHITLAATPAATATTSGVGVQPDGRVVWATVGGGGTRVQLRRYSAGGALDGTFGTNGIVTVPTADVGTAARVQVVIEPNTTILVAVGSEIARFTGEGVLDTTFGNGLGYEAVPEGMIAAGIALQANGDVIVGANSVETGGTAGYVFRLTTAGVLDTTYGTGGGKAVATSAYARVEVGDVAVDAAGNTLVTWSGTLTPAGSSGGTLPDTFGLERLLPTGAGDSSFGSFGLVLSGSVASGTGTSRVAVGGDGTIYQAEDLNQGTGTDSANLYAFTTLGFPIGNEAVPFGQGGGITGLAVQADLKPVVSGYDFTGTTTGTDIVLYRFVPITSANPAGLDPNYNYLGTFEGGAPGNTGYTLYSDTNGGASDTVAPNGDRGTAFAMGADGGLFIAAVTHEGSTDLYSLTKLTNDQYQNVGSISGTVYSDTNADGVQQAGESGLPDRDVFLDYNGTGTFGPGDVEVLTDDTGGYSFIGLPHAQYRVVQPLGTGETDSEPAGVDYYAGVNVLVDINTGGINFGIVGANVTPTPTPTPTPTAGTGEITGTCFLDNDGNGVQSATEPGLYDWGVYLDLNHDGVRDAGDTRVFTDAQGHFVFTGLAAGTYSLRQNTPTGYTRTTAAFPRSVVVTADGAATVDIGNEYNGTAGVPAVGQITGTVFDDANSDGTLDDGEAGQAGFGVYLDNNNDGVYDAGDVRVLAGANGLYQFLGLTAGTYNVRENTPAGYTLTTPAFPRVVTVLPDAAVRVDIGNHLTGTGYVTGTVFADTNGNGVQNGAEAGLYDVTVYADVNGDGMPDDTDIVVTTNANGQYTIPDLAPGTYAVRETLPTGYTLTTAAFPVTVTVTADAGVTLNIGNEPAA